MEKTNFCKREGFSDKGFEITKESQIEMIQRAYPDYDAKNDWVLWLVFDLYHDKKPENTNCSIEIKKDNGEILEIPYVVRKPYPNKRLHQVCMVPEDKRKRIFGIPLVFKNYEGLLKIKEITIKWRFFEKCGLSDNNKNLAVQYATTEAHYYLNFKGNTKHPNFKIFTLSSKEMSSITDYGDKTEEMMETYMSHFDFVAYSEANIKLESSRIKTVELEVTEYYRDSNFSKYNLGRQFIRYENRIRNFSQEEADEIEKNVKEVFITTDVQYYPMYCMKHLTLEAEEIADIVPEPSFGFTIIL